MDDDTPLSALSTKKIVKYQSANEYTLIDELGSGTFGEVWIAVDSDDSSVAIKFMNANRYEGYDESVLNEIAYPLSLNHPNIVKYHAILGPEPIETIPQLEIEATTVIGVTMDTADGNLHSLIKNNKKILDEF
jgi:serine/threonine protein kinase